MQTTKDIKNCSKVSTNLYVDAADKWLFGLFLGEEKFKQAEELLNSHLYDNKWKSQKVTYATWPVTTTIICTYEVRSWSIQNGTKRTKLHCKYLEIICFNSRGT